MDDDMETVKQRDGRRAWLQERNGIDGALYEQL